MRNWRARRRITLLRWALGFAATTFAACGGGGGGGSAEFTLPTPAVNVRVEAVVPHAQGATGLTFLPDGRLLFNEIQTGDVRVVQGGALLPEPYVSLGVSMTPSAGLLGITADARFDENPFVYVFHNAENPPRSRVHRFRDLNGKGTEDTVLIDNIPVGGHDGGKMLSLRDGSLYITGGDAGNPANSQDAETLAGKILRVTRDGQPASGSSPIVASGFRNAFGIAMNPLTGSVFISENGPDCDDEIDLLVRGGNYGWRLGQACGDSDRHFQQPIVRINPTLGITGAAFAAGAMFPEWDHQLLLGDFNTGAVRRYAISEDGDAHVVEEGIVFPGGAGPIVDLAIGPEGAIYCSTLDSVFRIVRAE